MTMQANFWRICGVFLAACLLLPGCRDEPDVAQYEEIKDVHLEPPQRAAARQVPLTSDSASTPEADATADARDGDVPVTAQEGEAKGEMRLLGAIAHHAGQFWFFKVAGPAAQVGPHAGAFHEFIDSLKFTDDPDRPVTWTLPGRWHDHGDEDGGPAGLRYATIHLSHNPPLEITVIPLSERGQSIEANISRWREQLGLPPLRTVQDLQGIAHTHEVGGVTVIHIDMTGPGADAAPAQAQRPAGGAAPFAPFAGGRQSAPPGARLGPVIEEPPTDLPFTFELPEGWRQHQPVAGVITRIAEFSAGPQDAPAELAITAFPGDVGGLLANVNRWRSNDLGMGPVDAADVEQYVSGVEVAGVQSQYVDLSHPPDSGADRRRVLVMLVPHEGQTWFLKFWGPYELVNAEKENFELFARSFQFKN